MHGKTACRPTAHAGEKRGEQFEGGFLIDAKNLDDAIGIAAASVGGMAAGRNPPVIEPGRRRFDSVHSATRRFPVPKWFGNRQRHPFSRSHSNDANGVSACVPKPSLGTRAPLPSLLHRAGQAGHRRGRDWIVARLAGRWTETLLVNHRLAVPAGSGITRMGVQGVDIHGIQAKETTEKVSNASQQFAI